MKLKWICNKRIKKYLGVCPCVNTWCITCRFSCILFQVHRIDFDDENNIINKTTFVHSDGELWHISASSMSHNVIATVYNHSKLTLAVMFAINGLVLFFLPSGICKS